MVDTLTPAPPRTPPRVMLADREPRRWPYVAAGVTFLAILVVGAVTMSVLSHYEPLRFAGGGYGVGPRDLIRERIDAMSPTGESFQQIDVELSTTEQLWFNIEITNDGPLPITLETMPTLPRGAIGFDIQSVRIGPAGVGRPAYEPANAVPLTSVPMAPHEHRYLWIRGTFTGCWDTDTETGFGSIPMRFRVMGMQRDQDFYLPFTIAATPDTHVCG